jgi:hypothetical protein
MRLTERKEECIVEFTGRVVATDGPSERIVARNACER